MSFKLCAMELSYVGILAVLLCIIDRSLGAIEDYVNGDQDYVNPNVAVNILTEVPKGLSFTCNDKIPGYYADVETNCQVWHWCVPSFAGTVKYSFVCGPGTAFNQRTRVCDFDFNVDCANAQSLYGVNEDLYKDQDGNYIGGKKGKAYYNTYDRRRLTARLKRLDRIRKHTTQEKTDVSTS